MRSPMGVSGHKPHEGKDPLMAHGKSDALVVPMNLDQVQGREAGHAETVGSGPHRPSAETRTPVATKLTWITERAKRDKTFQFTSLAHLLDETFLTACFKELKNHRAPGIDGITLEEYGRNLPQNLENLVARLKQKAYRPQAVKRVYIPKSDGRQRPLGLPAVEDKIVQRGIAKILETIGEQDFRDCSYGFRPQRGCHMALQRLDHLVMTRPTQWVVDVDMANFFDGIPQHWIMVCLRQRITDTSLLRLIVRFLKAGVMEDGRWHPSHEGVPQGGNLSPILANIVLHYVLDTWFYGQHWHGEAHIIRYADDFVACFESRQEAERFHQQLRERLGQYKLHVAETKTHVIEFGRQAWQHAQHGGPQPKTFDFLGFTHYCDRTRKGAFKLGRQTSRKRLSRALRDTRNWLKAVRNQAPLATWWPILGKKLVGHYNYYGISGNLMGLRRYYVQLVHEALKWLNRRSQRRSFTRARYFEWLKRHPLPQPKIYHGLYAWSPCK